jgi:hypothetical protein
VKLLPHAPVETDLHGGALGILDGDHDEKTEGI